MHFAVHTCIKKEGNVSFHSFYSQRLELWPNSISACCKSVSVSFTWSLEVDASHLHRVRGVMGRNVCVVQQALRPRL